MLCSDAVADVGAAVCCGVVADPLSCILEGQEVALPSDVVEGDGLCKLFLDLFDWPLAARFVY